MESSGNLVPKIKGNWSFVPFSTWSFRTRHNMVYNCQQAVLLFKVLIIKSAWLYYACINLFVMWLKFFIYLCVINVSIEINKTVKHTINFSILWNSFWKGPHRITFSFKGIHNVPQ
jgi:hypothetical protein